MTNLRIKIIDLDHNNKIVEVEDLTKTGAESLIYGCEKMLSQLKDKLYEGDEDETD